MLLFRSEDQVAAWLADKNLTRGASVSLEQIWALSKLWYSDRLSPDFKGRSLDDAQAILTAVGLTDRFWSLRG
jgi:hypothetical protein